MTNREFARDVNEFIQACQRAGISATRRQASKYRNRRGKAYKEGKR